MNNCTQDRSTLRVESPTLSQRTRDENKKGKKAKGQKRGGEKEGRRWTKGAGSHSKAISGHVTRIKVPTRIFFRLDVRIRLPIKRPNDSSDLCLTLCGFSMCPPRAREKARPSVLEPLNISDKLQQNDPY